MRGTQDSRFGASTALGSVLCNSRMTDSLLYQGPQLECFPGSEMGAWTRDAWGRSAADRRLRIGVRLRHAVRIALCCPCYWH